MNQVLLKVAVAAPEIALGNPQKNREIIIENIKRAQAANAGLVIFPELALTGVTMGDLLFQPCLISCAKAALENIVNATAGGTVTAVVGAPLEFNSQLLNCAVVIRGGKVLGVCAKACKVADDSPALSAWQGSVRAELFGQEVELSDNLTCLTYDGTAFDLAVGLNAGLSAKAPSDILVNPAYTRWTVGSRRHNQTMAEHISSKTGAHLLVCGGKGESNACWVYDTQTILAQNGETILDSHDYFILADINIKKADPSGQTGFICSCDGCNADLANPAPFLPKENPMQFCGQVLQICATGLASRLERAHAKTAVLAVSGGLDSTLAMLISIRALKLLGWPSQRLICVTMPGLGTGATTYNSALELMEKFRVTALNISIANAVRAHFADIGHDESEKDLVYENAQARERTQIVMDLANKHGGIVVGTGDLSELALGFCTFGGDHMSMYSVNGSIPKTLVRFMVNTLADHPDFIAAGQVLRLIASIPISPELLPGAQHTEDIIGPYELHDYFLYHILKSNYPPEKVAGLCHKAFGGKYTGQQINKHLAVFLKRFLTQQFKRNCAPDGVNAGVVSLSPTVFKMPSDLAVGSDLGCFGGFLQA